VISCYSFNHFVPKDLYFEKNPDEPIYFLDSIEMNKMALENFDPSDFVSIKVVKGKNAIKLLGEKGKNGIVYIETKAAAKQRYWAYFKSISKDLAKLTVNPANDELIQFILNGRSITTDFDNQLMEINDKNLKSIKLIGTDELIKTYGVKNKSYGVIIIADLPPVKEK
jgi:hypothetical protein